uniref:Uncharacterized protein n=1 Tax=Zea mays TaxID=4577 RepID=C0P7H2_MAIZE|nr:unknown [Zea mays]
MKTTSSILSLSFELNTRLHACRHVELNLDESDLSTYIQFRQITDYTPIQIKLEGAKGYLELLIRGPDDRGADRNACPPTLPPDLAATAPSTGPSTSTPAASATMASFPSCLTPRSLPPDDGTLSLSSPDALHEILDGLLARLLGGVAVHTAGLLLVRKHWRGAGARAIDGSRFLSALSLLPLLNASFSSLVW